MSRRPKDQEPLLTTGAGRAGYGGAAGADQNTFVTRVPGISPVTGGAGDGYSKAYQALTNVMTEAYLVRNEADIMRKFKKANSSPEEMTCWTALSTLLCLCWMSKGMVVDQGEVGLLTDGQGGYEMLGPGAHYMLSAFKNFKGKASITESYIRHGNLHLITVPQGQVAYLEDQGHPLVLGFGMHYIESSTLLFRDTVSINCNIVHLGPYTLVTVEAGYAAVTQDNGKQIVLDEPGVYLLGNANWTFVKYVPLKLLTREFGPCEVSTADGVTIPALRGEVIFQIKDPHKAARELIQAMRATSGSRAEGRAVDLERESRIQKLEADLQRLLIGVLTEKVGQIHFKHVSGSTDTGSPPRYEEGVASVMQESIRHGISDELNRIFEDKGVKILEVKLRNPVPTEAVQKELAAAALARAQADKAVEIARGQADSSRLAAKGDADAQLIEAEGYAKATGIRAQADLNAAKLLSTVPLASSVRQAEAQGAAAAAALRAYGGSVLVSGSGGVVPQLPLSDFAKSREEAGAGLNARP